MAEFHELTAAEAAFILRQPVKTVKKALDKGPVRAKVVQLSGRSVRTVNRSDLLFLLAEDALHEELTPKARREFYDALQLVSVEKTEEVRFGALTVVISDFRSELATRTRELDRLSERVNFRDDGEAILKGTSIEVHRIAALLSGGMKPEQVRRDYPSLSLEQIDTAKAYADAHPKSGRPYPSKTVKSALRGAGLEALDSVLDKKKRR